MIRRGMPADAPEASRINILGWQHAFRGLIPSNYLDSMSVEQRSSALAERFNEPHYKMAIAQDDGGLILGFADWGPCRETIWPYETELYAIYVHPDFQRQGIGQKLIQEIVRDILANGTSSLMLCVLAINPCIPFYRKLYGTELGERKREMWGKEYKIIYFGWERAHLQKIQSLSVEY